MGNKILRFLGFEFDEDGDLLLKVLPLNWLIAVMGIMSVFILLFSTWYTVDKDENATERIFGRYSRTTEPGFHLKLPWPVMEVKKTVVTKVQRMEIGFRTEEVGPPAVYKDIIEEGEMLTGDANIADLDFIVQYRTPDASAWQFKVKDPEGLLNNIAQASMRLIIGYSEFDRAATDGKSEIQERTKKLLQALCDEVSFGVKIVAVQLQDVHAPKDVMPAFNDVMAAREDKEKLIHEAEAYKNDIIPKARGEAQRMINEAKGYEAKRVEGAKGDTLRWLEVWKRYRENPEVTEKRMRYEVLKEILPGSDLVIDLDNKAGLLKFLDIGKAKDEEGGK